MKSQVRGWRTAVAVSLMLLLGTAGSAVAFQMRPKSSRFDALVVHDPSTSPDVATTPLASLPSTENARGAWETFRAKHGQSWAVYLDRRSGAPLLVEGKGIPWPIPKSPTVRTIAASLRTFIAANRTLLLADDAELILDPEASGPLSPEVWQIAFNRESSGISVVGERYLFTIGYGNLVSFGAPRWSRIDANPVPELDPTEALLRLTAYMGYATTFPFSRGCRSPTVTSDLATAWSMSCTAGSPPCSIGNCARWATRSPTWAISASIGTTATPSRRAPTTRLRPAAFPPTPIWSNATPGARGAM